MEEPGALSPLPGRDGRPADDAVKRYEQNAKLSGTCLAPPFRRRAGRHSAFSTLFRTRGKARQEVVKLLPQE